MNNTCDCIIYDNVWIYVCHYTDNNNRRDVNKMISKSFNLTQSSRSRDVERYDCTVLVVYGPGVQYTGPPLYIRGGGGGYRAGGPGHHPGS